MKRFTVAICMLGALLLIVILGILSSPQEAEAIPAFARKYSMSCTTCHAPFPRLNDYGDEFAGNGFVLKDKDAPRYFVETGDAHLSLIRDLPVAVRLEGFIKHQSETGKEVDLTAPYNLKLLSGGAIAKNVSYYFYFFFSERGEVAGVEDAFIMFNDLFKQDLDIYVGQFQISDPLFKRELRLTYEDYMIYKTGIGESEINLSYDRGIMITYGAPTGTDIILELLNGNGIGAADEDHTYDRDKYKNIFGRVSQGINDYLRIGGCGFFGKDGPENPNRTWMLGGDATVSYKIAELNFQYLERRDDNPFFMSIVPDEEVKTRGGLTELIILPNGDRSRWYLTGLYNWVEGEYDIDDYETLTGHVGYLMRTNFRLIAEDTYDIVNEENRFVLGFVAAF